MNIIEALKKLRDDIKTWATNNFKNVLTKQKATDDKVATIEETKVNKADLKYSAVSEGANVAVTESDRIYTVALKDQIELTEVKATTVATDTLETPTLLQNGDTLSVSDTNGNIVAQINEAGLNTVNVKVNGRDVALQENLDAKQDKLTAGSNITISEDGIISATGGSSDNQVRQISRLTGTDAKPLLLSYNSSAGDEVSYTYKADRILYNLSNTTLELNGASLAVDDIKSYSTDLDFSAENISSDCTYYGVSSEMITLTGSDEVAIDSGEQGSVNIEGGGCYINATITQIGSLSTLAEVTINAPDGSIDGEIGAGTAGSCLKTNGSQVYWAPDNDTVRCAGSFSDNNLVIGDATTGSTHIKNSGVQLDSLYSNEYSFNLFTDSIFLTATGTLGRTTSTAATGISLALNSAVQSYLGYPQLLLRNYSPNGTYSNPAACAPTFMIAETGTGSATDSQLELFYCPSYAVERGSLFEKPSTTNLFQNITSNVWYSLGTIDIAPGQWQGKKSLSSIGFLTNLTDNYSITSTTTGEISIDNLLSVQSPMIGNKAIISGTTPEMEIYQGILAIDDISTTSLPGSNYKYRQFTGQEYEWISGSSVKNLNHAVCFKLMHAYGPEAGLAGNNSKYYNYQYESTGTCRLQNDWFKVTSNVDEDTIDIANAKAVSIQNIYIKLNR